MVGSVAGQWHLGGLSEALSVQASWNVFWERRDRSGCFWDVGVLPFFLFPGRGGEPFSFFFFLSLSLSLPLLPPFLLTCLPFACVFVFLSLFLLPPSSTTVLAGIWRRVGTGILLRRRLPRSLGIWAGFAPLTQAVGSNSLESLLSQAAENGETLEVAGKAFMRI